MSARRDDPDLLPIYLVQYEREGKSSKVASPPAQAVNHIDLLFSNLSQLPLGLSPMML